MRIFGRWEKMKTNALPAETSLGQAQLQRRFAEMGGRQPRRAGRLQTAMEGIRMRITRRWTARVGIQRQLRPNPELSV